MIGSGYFHVDEWFDADGRRHRSEAWEPGWQPDIRLSCSHPRHCLAFVDATGHPSHSCTHDECNGIPINNHFCDEKPIPGTKNQIWHKGIPCPCGQIGG